MQDQTTMLCRLFQNDFLKDETNPEMLSVFKLILLGLLLCSGSEQLKCRVLYDILQDDLQDKISASDKDFSTTFEDLIEVSCYMILDVYREESKRDYNTDSFPEMHSKEF